MRDTDDRFVHDVTPIAAFLDEGDSGEADANASAEEDRGAAAERCLARTIAASIVPGLVAAARPRVSPADVERLVGLLMRGQDEPARRMTHELRARGISAEAIRADLLGPAAVRLGVLWEQDACDFATLSLGTGRIQAMLRDVRSRRPARRTARRRILLAAAPGEQHVLGVLMIAEDFRAAGWEVLCRVPAAHADLVQVLARDWFDLVGLSVAADRHLAPLADVIRALRRVSFNPSLKVMLGGAMVARDPGLAARVGADWAAVDASGAVSDAGRRLGDG